MKLASFLFLSITIHAFALAYPVSFLEPKQPQFIPVVILPAEGESTAGRAEGKAGESPAPAEPAKSSTRKTSLNQHVVESKRNNEPEPQSQLVAVPSQPFQNPISALVLLPSKPNENDANGASKNSSAPAGNGNDVEGVGGNGNGLASSGTGGELGNGNGANLIQARYRETPKPIYPESARRKGREGTVLLRVLVNEEGRAKTIEIYQSSGDESLDRAATESIQQSRFIPARYGQKAVESWIRIPVDFHLADSNPR